MDAALRLRDRATGSCFIVDTAKGKVYADRHDRRSIGREDEFRGDAAERALKSARENAELFELAVPGNTTFDGKFDVRGTLTRQEEMAFAGGGRVPSERPALLLHLDFFDGDLDGKITLTENYGGWRRLGFSRLAGLWKTLTSALFFGRVGARMAIDVGCIGEKRYASGTGIYDAAGCIDRARLDTYLAAFDAVRRPLSFAETMALLERHSAKGTVSRTQFRSLFSVCERLNRGEKVVTRAQFCGLFEGSLLWLAAARSK